MDYCAECQKAIDDALSKIPQKCRAYYSFVTNSETKEKLERIFKEENKEIAEDRIIQRTIDIAIERKKCGKKKKKKPLTFLPVKNI